MSVVPKFLLFLALLANFHQTSSFKIIQARTCVKFLRAALQLSAAGSMVVENEGATEILDVLEMRRTVPVVNTAGMNISASNYFGKQVLSTAECKRELIGLLTNAIEIEEEFLDYRVEYLTKYLEYKYIPIQTTPFLNFALSGEWAMLYSNILTPRADDTLQFKIFQEINPNDETGSSSGVINNIINWKLDRSDDQSSGDLVVNCKYLFNTKGDLDVTLVEHLLMPKDESPKDVEDLILSIQRSVPFESFDPNDIRVKNTVSLILIID